VRCCFLRPAGAGFPASGEVSGSLCHLLLSAGDRSLVVTGVVKKPMVPGSSQSALTRSFAAVVKLLIAAWWVANRRSTSSWSHLGPLIRQNEPRL
jgi:hypothetical protein